MTPPLKTVLTKPLRHRVRISPRRGSAQRPDVGVAAVDARSSTSRSIARSTFAFRSARTSAPTAFRWSLARSWAMRSVRSGLAAASSEATTATRSLLMGAHGARPGGSFGWAATQASKGFDL